MAGDDPHDDPEFPGVDQPFEVPEGFGPPGSEPPTFPPPESEPGSFPPPQNYPPPSSGTPPPSYPPPESSFPPPASGAAPPPTSPPPAGGQFSPPAPGGAPPPGPVPPSAYPPPGGYAAPTGGPVLAEPGKKKGLGCLGWGLIVGGLLIVLAAGCSFLVFQASQGPTEAANDFLADVERGDFAAAADRAADRSGSGALCTITASDLERDLAGLSDYTVFGFGAGGEGGVGGEVVVNGDSRGLAMEMVEEDGTWKPCTYEVDDG